MIAQRISSSSTDRTERYFRNEIKDTIQESRLFLAVKPRDYFQSKWTNLEYDEAKAHKAPQAFLETDVTLLKNCKQFAKLIELIEKKL